MKSLVVIWGWLLLFVSELVAIEASVIVASVEGEVTSMSIEDEFTVTLTSSSVGKKVEEKSILVTGDTGSASLLFSNGALITIKPGSRFYLRKFAQKSFNADQNAIPSEIEEEPSQSELLAHLDFGNLIVKAPKLNKSSTMVLSSPLGTAGIRGTMFQLVAVRNSVTGDITGGVNLISGDISFTDVGGNEVSLVSGQSLQLASGKLGESMATVPGGLVNLTATYGESLTGGAMPPSIDMLFPGVTGDGSSTSTTSSVNASQNELSADTDWEMVHEIASEIFFTIESSETSSASFSFDDVSDAVTVSTPTPQNEAPSVPSNVAGEVLTTVEGLEDLYIEAPTIYLTEGANKIFQDQLIIEYLVQRKNINYPLNDFGPFKIMPTKSKIYPSYSAITLGDIDISSDVVVSNLDAVDFTTLGHESKITLYVDDFSFRKVNFADGKPVSSTITPTVRIVDSQKPVISFSEGQSSANPLLVEGKIGASFIDPGISLVDNYYNEQEIINFNGLSQGAEKSSFGTVNVEVAGIYEITYQGISDPSGNLVEPTTRWVQVVDNTPPQATLYGSNPIYIDLNASSVFKDPGVFGIDNLDGTIEWGDSRIKVLVEMLVDDNLQSYNSVTNSLENVIAEAKTQESVNATFRLKYQITDLAGNRSEIFRQLVLINSPFKTPTMVMHGKNPLYHEVNTAFSDPGVTAYKDMGTGVSPINLNNKVSALAYLGSSVSGLDSSVVNYHFINKKYVDQSGNEDSNKKIVIKYNVADEFGNQAKLEREVRIVDTTPPVITQTGSGGVDLLNLQAGVSYSDPGAVVSDNYDTSPTIAVKLHSSTTNSEFLDPSGGNVFTQLSSIGFWEPGDYKIVYRSTDTNGNLGESNRTVRVVDTIAPLISVIPHSFLSSPSTNSLNSEAPLVSSIVSYPSSPLPSEILSELLSLPGYDHAKKTYVQIDADPYINTFGSDKDFYIKDLPLDPNDVIFDDSVTGQTTKIVNDSWGRSFIWYSAFKIKFVNGVTLQDPGVYVRNDSNLVTTVTSSLIKTKDLANNPFKYFVSYSAEQSNGQKSTVSNARTIRFLDAVAPSIDLTPFTDGSYNFVLAEGGVSYGDSDSSVFTWIGSTKNGPVTLTTNVIDAAEGSIPEKLVRTIFAGLVVDANHSTVSPLSTVYNYNSVTENNRTQTEISQAVSSKINTGLSSKNMTYTIKYDAKDSANNAATSKYRYVIVKDTLAPTISTPTNQTLVVDYTSSSNPNIMDVQSVKDYMVADLNVTDANNFEPKANLSWNVSFNPTYQPGVPYPATKDGIGYTVTITSTDPSGNTSAPITRFLKVGDTKKPTLTMMGKNVIHDFLRFKSNASLENDELPFSDRPIDPSTNPETNSSGFKGGEHRMLLADYNFVDPGVYAEDNNSAWNIADNYPDLDGDGIGEGYALVKVGSVNDVTQCSNGPNIIHVYSHFEEQSVALNSKSMSEWQTLLKTGTYGFPSAAKIPKVWDSTTNTGDHNFTDSNKDNDPSTLTNLEMTIVTINYRVKDGWDNYADPMSRTVYIYESVQYSGYAFYATPLTDINGNAFEDYDNNGSTGKPSMSAARKDTDGDGVSDFWEMALGNSSDFKNPSVFPVMNSEDTFKILNPNYSSGGITGLSTSALTGNLIKLNAASRLKQTTESGIKDFSAVQAIP